MLVIQKNSSKLVGMLGAHGCADAHEVLSRVFFFFFFAFVFCCFKIKISVETKKIVLWRSLFSQSRAL